MSRTDENKPIIEINISVDADMIASWSVHFDGREEAQGQNSQILESPKHIDSKVIAALLNTVGHPYSLKVVLSQQPANSGG